jgi:hypothetical protein
VDRSRCASRWVTGAGWFLRECRNPGKAFKFVTPSADRYYLLAKCDMDLHRKTFRFSYYFTSSVIRRSRRSAKGNLGDLATGGRDLVSARPIERLELLE